MLVNNSIKQKFIPVLLMLLIAGIAGHTQGVNRNQPIWWFGQSVAANFNTYRGTTQVLNNEFSTPTAFHKGKGVKPYFSLLTEYRPNKTWGGMLNIGYDNRGGKFDGVLAPCDCPATLKTNISYITIEPSLRVAPFGSAFYLFAGPTLSFNIAKEFIYTQEKQEDRVGEWSDIRKTVFSAQAGAGIDLMLSAKNGPTQVSLSPFVSFLTDIGRQPRVDQTWSFYTVRAGVALKFGMARKGIAEVVKTEPVVAAPVVAIVPQKDVQFSVRAPKVIPIERKVKETFPFRNSVFFDIGSTEIPNRYTLLNPSQAKAFKEEQLQEGQPDNLNRGRSSRQMAVYYNILNIIGDRLRSNAGSTILLSGAADNNPGEGLLMAEKVRNYLVNNFSINTSRITVEGRDKPVIPSEQPGATRELVLLREGDRRVDIVSTSPELLLQVGGKTSAFLKPIQIMAVHTDPLDSHVLLNVEGAKETLKSWSVEITDENGAKQNFGPYTNDKVSIPGKTILGNNTQGNYKIIMMGQTKSGKNISKESSVSLTKTTDPKQEGLRYSILFDFDQSKSIDAYEKFLVEIVTPLIPENGTVIIHGHTDIIGEDVYNHNLSHDRAVGAQKIIQRELNSVGRKGVRFETYGFGEDLGMAPFENNFPEERFYNRTVIIDIIPGN